MSHSPCARPYTVALLIPTGIGCAIGGYAGDALPLARVISRAVDCLITHPNVLNGAQLYWPLDNALYVEGYALDRFAAGVWGLTPVGTNRVGLILDAGIEPDLRLRQIQAAEAVRATLGLTLAGYTVTDRPLNVSLQQSDTGASWGQVEHLDSLLRAAQVLLSRGQAEAIAVVARFPDDPDSEALQAYRQGQGVDGLAGAEAVISHAIVREFQVPCAHAPALQPLPLDPTISPRSAAEELGYTFLPCVLVGLSRAPQYQSLDKPGSYNSITSEDVNLVITPASACGGAAVLHWAAQGKTILAVAENTTTLSVFPELLGIQAIPVQSYLEAVGYILSQRAGVDPQLLRSSFPPLGEIFG
ncbi:MAG: DUF3326 domain-containing protein [Prochlorotrichaceae cyanobacterium]